MSPLERLFDRRVRGFRVVEIAAVACCLAMMVWVYWTKTEANEERTRITRMERAIAAEERQLRLLRAEAAHLEKPARIEQLSTTYLGLAPVSARREAETEALTEIARDGGGPAR